MPPHGVHPAQAAKELKAAGISPKVTSPVHKFLQGEAQRRGFTGVPSPSVSAVPKGYKPGKKIDLGPQPLLGFKPKHIARQQKQLGQIKKGIAKENAQYAAMVNPLSHQNLQFAAEGLTGYHEIAHIRNHPIAGSLALAGLLPFGRVPDILNEGRAVEAGVKAAREGKGISGALEARRAIKAARRGPKLSAEEAHAHLLDLSKQAAEHPKVQAAMDQPKIQKLKPGEVSAETGGKAGQIIRHGLSPNFKGLVNRLPTEDYLAANPRERHIPIQYRSAHDISVGAPGGSHADMPKSGGVQGYAIVENGKIARVNFTAPPGKDLKYLGKFIDRYDRNPQVQSAVKAAVEGHFSGPMGQYEKVGAKLDNPGVKELRKAQEELRGVARSKKAGALREAQGSAKSWEQLTKAGSVRAGELPAGLFKGFEGLQPQHLEQLRQFINEAPLRPFEKQNLVDAINKGMAGHVPTEGEHLLMERAFGREAADSMASAIKQGGLKKVLADIINIPRAFKSSGDLSWGFRQGLGVAAYNPKLFAKTFGRMFKPAFSEKEHLARMAAIHADPMYPLAVKAGVPFTDIGSASKGVEQLSQREEAIMSNYAEHLHELPGVKSTPGVKQVAHGVSSVIRASDRGYVTPLNEVRLDLFKQLTHQAVENGWHMNDKLLEDIGSKFVGALTGRGDLPKFLRAHRASINALFFSPGLMASRINMINPVWYMRLEPFARQQAFRAAGNLSSTLFAVLFAARMAGAKVQMDPRNSDFGKIRIGNTRIDIAGGYSQYLTLLGRLSTGTEISSTTGKKTKLSGKSFGTSDFDIVQNFFLNKLAPVPSEAVTALKGNRFGQPLTPTGELGQMFSPLLWNDIYQLSTAKGPGGGPGMAAATFLPDLFGIGVQNYAPPKKKAVGNPFGGSTGGGLPDSGSVGGGLPG